MTPSAGRFELRGLLGQGGGGAVHRGWDHQRGCEVAIKSLLEPYTADDVQRVLARVLDGDQGRALIELRHPHVVRAVACEPGPPPRLVMELLPHGSLEDRLRASGPLPVDEALQLGRVLAETLAFVHARGFLHRDLKPANVLLGDQGQPKLSDFGLTRGAHAHTITRTGEVLGTPNYLAPEQARAAEIDARTDVYGLGATLYAVLSGRPPVSGATAFEALELVAAGKITPLRQLRPEVPGWLERVVVRCLARDPRDRYASAQELAEALQRPAPTRSKTPALVGGLALLALAGALLGVALPGGDPGEPPATEQTPPDLPLQARLDAVRERLHAAAAEGPAELRRALREVAAGPLAEEPELWPLRIERYHEAGRPRMAGELLARALARAPEDPALLTLARTLELEPERAQPVFVALEEVWAEGDAWPSTTPAEVLGEQLPTAARLRELAELERRGEWIALERAVLEDNPRWSDEWPVAMRVADTFEVLGLLPWAQAVREPWVATQPHAALIHARWATSRDAFERSLEGHELSPHLRELGELTWLLEQGDRAAAGEAFMRLRDSRFTGPLAQTWWLALRWRLRERGVARGLQYPPAAELEQALEARTWVVVRRELLTALVKARLTDRDFEGALAACRDGLELAPGDAELAGLASAILMHEERWEDAWTLLAPHAARVDLTPRVREDVVGHLVTIAYKQPKRLEELDRDVWLSALDAAFAHAVKRGGRGLGMVQRLNHLVFKLRAWGLLERFCTYGVESFPLYRKQFSAGLAEALAKGRGLAAAERYLAEKDATERLEIELVSLVAAKEHPQDDGVVWFREESEVYFAALADEPDPWTHAFLFRLACLEGDDAHKRVQLSWLKENTPRELQRSINAYVFASTQLGPK